MDPTERANLMSAPAVRCKAISKSSKKQCKNWAIKGGEVCRNHGGNAKQVRAKAAIRAEVMNWRLGYTHVDPGEVLLRLVTQSATRQLSQRCTPDFSKRRTKRQSV
jgi:hypothetical protein